MQDGHVGTDREPRLRRRYERPALVKRETLARIASATATTGSGIPVDM
jgi:hypothetical protein